MGIDLRRASVTLFGTRVKPVKKAGLYFGVDEPAGQTTPLQIMARTSAVRSSCGWDKEVILCRSCLLVELSEFPMDSSFILSISHETCTDCISGKLRRENKNLQAVQLTGNIQRGKTREHLINNVAMCQVAVDVCLSLLPERWYIILRADQLASTENE